MGVPAATLGSMHTCPLYDGTTPHVGGVIIEGSPNVMIEKKPASRQLDKAQCASPAINGVQMGSATVFINSLPAARVGDMTMHGGVITQGAGTVLIG